MATQRAVQRAAKKVDLTANETVDLWVELTVEQSDQYWVVQTVVLMVASKALRKAAMMVA